MSRPTADDGAAEFDSAANDAGAEHPGAERGGRTLPDTGLRRRSAMYRVLLMLGSFSLVLVLLVVGFLWYLTDRYAGNVTRIPDVFASLDPATRPDPPTPAAGTDDIPMTFLLAGSDSRAGGPTTGESATAEAGSERADVLMLWQISADRESAFAISIPRDSFVPVPGFGTTKINAAFAHGGPTLVVQTVEQLTNVRVDHFLSVDFTGFKQVTDALGGVDVRIAEATEAHGVSFARGLNHLDGDAALAYVRQRHRLPGGDLDSVLRHQNYLRAVMSTVSRENLLTDPGRFDDFLLAVTASLSVDEELSDYDLLTLVFDLRNLQPSDVAFLTAPVAGTGVEGDSSVVYLDMPKATEMWSYVNTGTLQQHLAEFTQLPEVPR